MNMINSTKFVRALLSDRYDIATIEIWGEEATACHYIAVLRPKGQITYRRVALTVCARSSDSYHQWIARFGISPGGKVGRSLDYGLGSWCCVARQDHCTLNMVCVVSTKRLKIVN